MQKLVRALRWVLGSSVLALLAWLGAAPAWAQEWPKIVRIVVPYPAGTGPDIMARLLGDRLSRRTGQSFVVENKSGANAILGSDLVAKAPADGSVLLLVDRLTLSVNPLLYKPLPYDPRKDLASVSNVADVKLYLMVRGDFPANTFKDFVAHAKAHPGKVAFGTGGTGSVLHLNMEAIQAGTGVDLLHVPYRAFAEVVPALLGEQVQATAGGIEAVQKFVEDRKIKLLAIGAPARAEVSPEVPTIEEAGGTQDMLLSTAYTLHTRAGTPAATIARISQDVTAVLAEPDVQKSTRQRGLAAYGTTPAVLDAQLDKDAAVIGKLVRERGIKVQ